MIPARARARADAVVRQLEVLWETGTFTGQSDAQLLGRFIGGGEGSAEPAFRELLDRHGPMVMAVCRQVLGRASDAEDAFQATFLVLVQKARAIRVGDSLAPWLHAVAVRTARRARFAASRQRTADVETLAEAAEKLADAAFDLDVRPMLHEELARLPEKYREPIVLCHLEGKSHEEAARLLAWPVGTVSGRLSRGRQLLKARLERRGVAVSSAMLESSRWLSLPSATATTTATAELLSPSLVESTLAAAACLATAGTFPAAVQSLTQGVLRTMLLDRIKIASLALVVLGIGTGGVAWTLRASRAGNAPAPPQQAAPEARVRVDVTRPKSAPQDPNAAQSNAPNARPPGTGAPGMMPGMMGGIPIGPIGKNAPNVVDPRHPMPVFRTQDILVVESPDRTSIQAMSLTAGDQDQAVWDKFTLPQGVTANPLCSADTLAPILKGKRIDHVAAFSRYTGVWSVQKLAKPAEEELTPHLAPGGVIYQVGNDVYAFSGRTGTWGALHLEGTEKPLVSASPSDIEVLQGNKLYVFSIKHGHWSPGVEIYIKPSQRPRPSGTPGR